jgi:hypothetical protein
MVRSPSGWLAAALLLLTGCAGGEPAARSPLVAIAGPEAFESFELRSGEQVLWRLVADEPTPLDELVYGDVPVGFRQETPAGATVPRALVEGELLQLESVTPRRVFLHEGFVTGDQRLSIDFWEMKLRRSPETPELDDPPASS